MRDFIEDIFNYPTHLDEVFNPPFKNDFPLRSKRFQGVPRLSKAINGITYIKYGAQGEFVKKIQKALIDLGYNLSRYGIDGILGKETHQAIVQFQIDSGLKGDGIVGPLTMTALDDAFASLDDTIIRNKNRSGDKHMDGYTPGHKINLIKILSINQLRIKKELKSAYIKTVDSEAGKIKPVPKILPSYIKRIKIDLSRQKIRWIWSDGRKSKEYTIDSGTGCPNTKANPCKYPNRNDSYCTPKGVFHPNGLGGKNYRNTNGDRMSYYVRFHTLRNIGIHESPARDGKGDGVVQGRPISHGCIRTQGWVAKRIHDNVSQKTIINITGDAPTVPFKKSVGETKKSYPLCS